MNLTLYMKFYSNSLDVWFLRRPLFYTNSIRPSASVATPFDRLKQFGVVAKPQYSSFRKVSLIHIGRPNSSKFGVLVYNRHNEYILSIARCRRSSHRQLCWHFLFLNNLTLFHANYLIFSC